VAFRSASEREWDKASPQEFLAVASFRGTRCQSFRLKSLHSNFKWCLAAGTLVVWSFLLVELAASVSPHISSIMNADSAVSVAVESASP
jgi:hypothetical protein